MAAVRGWHYRSHFVDHLVVEILIENSNRRGQEPTGSQVTENI